MNDKLEPTRSAAVRISTLRALPKEVCLVDGAFLSGHRHGSFLYVFKEDWTPYLKKLAKKYGKPTEFVVLHIPVEPRSAVGTELPRKKIAKEVADKIVARLKLGKETYGSSTFTHVDPLQDLEEELLDALVYLWVARRMK